MCVCRQIWAVSIFQSSPRACSEVKAITESSCLSVIAQSPGLPGIRSGTLGGLRGHLTAALAAGWGLLGGTGESSVFIRQVDIAIVPAPRAVRRKWNKMCEAQHSTWGAASLPAYRGHERPLQPPRLASPPVQLSGRPAIGQQAAASLSPGQSVTGGGRSLASVCPA